MDLQLKGSTVLITGGSSGIGKAAAIGFGQEGARVAVTYLKNREGAKTTVQAVRAAGGEAMELPYDLADGDSIEACLNSIGKEWGGLNVLVNNAAPLDIAGPTGQKFEEVPLGRWQTMLRDQLEGVVLTIQKALPLMRKSGWGRIVNVSSDAVDGWPGLGPYATAKSGLNGLTRVLAKELGQSGILTNVVMPGSVMTEQNESHISAEQKEQIRMHLATRRLTTPEDVARLILFLGSPVNTSITGETVRITGGR